MPNTSDSQRIIGRQKIIDDLAQTVLKKTEPFLSLTHRLEIHLPSSFKRQKNYQWLNNIIYSIKNNELEYWKASSGYCTNSINSELRRPPKYMTSNKNYWLFKWRRSDRIDNKYLRLWTSLLHVVFCLLLLPDPVKRPVSILQILVRIVTNMLLIL